MKIVHLSYAYIDSYDNPREWLKRIAFFTPLLERMADHAEVVAIYNINFRGKLLHNGVTYFFPGFGKSGLRWPIVFNEYVYSLQPDVIIVQGFSPWQILLLGRRASTTKIIVQHRAEKPFSGLKKLLQKKADRYINSYLFSAAELADNWIAGGQIESRAKVAEALGMSSIFECIERKTALSRTRVNSDLVFLWVGDLDANKNPLLAVEAFIEFLKQHPSTVLLLIYQGTTLESTVRARIQGVENSIRLVGKVPYDEMINWYNCADFILSTSYYESAGLSVCEGMSCGCIPVVTDIPSFRMMTDLGRVGLLVEPGNKDALLSAFKECVLMDRVDKKKKVLEYFKSKLSFDANVRTIMEVAN